MTVDRSSSHSYKKHRPSRRPIVYEVALGDAIPVSVEFSRSRRTTCVGTLTAAATASRWHRVDGVPDDHVDSRGIDDGVGATRSRDDAIAATRRSDDHEDGVTMASRRRRHGVAATPASSSSFTTRSHIPVDRLVAVEGDDRAALVAVDAPAKVDVVA